MIHPRAVESRDEAGAPSLTVNVKWAEDGTPAEGVAVRLVEFGTRTGIWKERWLVAGPDGVVRATHVTPGRVVATGDRGGSVGTTVGDGEAEPLTLEIPRAPPSKAASLRSMGLRSPARTSGCRSKGTSGSARS